MLSAWQMQSSPHVSYVIENLHVQIWLREILYNKTLCNKYTQTTTLS